MAYYPPNRRANWRNSMMNPPLKRNVRWQDLVPGNEYILNKGFIIKENNNSTLIMRRKVLIYSGLPINDYAKKIMILEQKPHIFKGYYLGALSFEKGDGTNISIYLNAIKDKFTFTQINEKNLAANKIRHFMTSRKVYKNAYKPPSGFYYKSALSRWENTTRKNNK